MHFLGVTSQPLDKERQSIVYLIPLCIPGQLFSCHEVLLSWINPVGT